MRAHGTRFETRVSDSSSDVVVDTTTCELRVAFASCTPSSVSCASRASHAASDAADDASVAALARAFRPSVSPPHIRSAVRARHLSARAAFASAEYRLPESREGSLGRVGGSHIASSERRLSKNTEATEISNAACRGSLEARAVVDVGQNARAVVWSSMRGSRG